MNQRLQACEEQCASRTGFNAPEASNPVFRAISRTLEAVNCPNRRQWLSDTETCLAVSPETQPVY
ncbi:hypothetical protein [Aphanocapsa montana]|uniref:hypothetical protein n=1 Tax=Lyngbya confervoides TaxID=207921 RepID=UPI001913561F